MSHPSYYMNLCGKKLDENSLNRIPAPRIELATHVTFKTTQAFGMIAACFAAPAVSVVKGQTDLASMQDRAYRFGKTGILTGLVLGPLITAAFVPGKSTDSIVDRCYRIRCNQKQLRADRLSILGLVAGVGTAYALGELLEKGAVLGYVGGFVTGVVLNKVL